LGNGGLGAAFFTALDLVGRHVRAPGQVGGAEAQRVTPVIDDLAEGRRLVSMAEVVRHLGANGIR